MFPLTGCLRYDQTSPQGFAFNPVRYRRTYITGGTYFFTVVSARRKPIFASTDVVDILRRAFRHVRANHPFQIDAICILPDHLHCLWTLPDNDSDHSTRWRLIKTRFTRACGENVARPVWQKRYWEHLIRDEDDFRRHVDYIHYNPVKHGLADRPIDWTYSSFDKWIERGHYPPDWGTDPVDFDDAVGSK